jgi:phage tail-like protein
VVATNANNETWYMLRYASDFTPRPAGVVPPFQSPHLDHKLLWDDQRHVLELRPLAPTGEAQPPPGVAVDPDGAVYRSDPDGARVVVTRCDGSERSLVRGRGVFASPAGLALDRLGFLYVADPIARRVVVVLPENGEVEAVLAQGLVDPVDVAVSPEVRVFVADRAGGTIVRFNGRFERCGEFAPRNAEGLPVKPKPIAVMVDADGSVLVADATYPRLLRFAPDGTPLADVDAAARVRSVTASGVTLAALTKIYGARMPRFLAGICRPPRPPHDGGEALAAAHLAIRLLLLHLDHDFADKGAWVSACLDGGSPGVQWDKVVLDAEIPAGCSIEVAAQSNDDPTQLASFASNETATTPALTHLHERLLFTPPGRYLRLRLKLRSDGTATPSVRAVRVFYPRVSYTDLLPRVFRRDADAASFLSHFLALFEHTLTRAEDRYERFSRDLNPATVPADAVDWLASLVDLAFDPSWSLARKRALLENIMELYRTRGTVRGIQRYIELYTGERPEILEGFLERPLQSPALGAQGMRLGATTLLSATSAQAAPETLLEHRFANRFTVFVYSTDECEDSVLLSVVDRIIATSRPAQAAYSLRLVRPEARVGTARVGLDVVLGARETPGTRLAGCPEPGALAKGRGVLGIDSVLGEARPGYPRPLVATL